MIARMKALSAISPRRFLGGSRDGATVRLNWLDRLSGNRAPSCSDEASTSEDRSTERQW